MRPYLAAGVRVALAELAEFLFRTRFEAPGSLTSIPALPSGNAGVGASAALHGWRFVPGKSERSTAVAGRWAA